MYPYVIAVLLCSMVCGVPLHALTRKVDTASTKSVENKATAPDVVQTPSTASATTVSATPAHVMTHSSTTSSTTAGGCAVDLQVGLSKMAETTLGGVVNIVTTQILNGRSAGGFMGNPMQGGDHSRAMPGSPFEDLFREFFGQFEATPRKVQSLGSGFVVMIQAHKAYIVTNYHVVSDAKKINVVLNNRVELDATIHGKDERTDLAVLEVDLGKLSAEKYPRILEWSEQNVSRVGHFVAAIGNAFGLGNTLTFGLISFKGRDLMARKHDYVDDFIQHTAPINMGNSGGPLLNMEGKVIGVNSAIFTPTGGHVGIGFAIPSELARKTVNALIKERRVRRGWLGVHIQPVENVDERERTIIVGKVTQGGPCDGILKQGDFIYKFNGITLDYENRLTRLVGETAPGTSITLEVSRKGEKEPRVVTVVVGESPENPYKSEVVASGASFNKKADAVYVPSLGMHVVMNEDVKGVIVQKMDDLSPARDAGLQVRDVIIEANRNDIRHVDDLQKIIQSTKEDGGQTVLMCIRRHHDINKFDSGTTQSAANEGIFFVSIKLWNDETRKSLDISSASASCDHNKDVDQSKPHNTKAPDGASHDKAKSKDQRSDNTEGGKDAVVTAAYSEIVPATGPYRGVV